MLFIYFLRSKDEASQALKKFLADVATIGRPQEIHSDNGGEYLSQAFQQVLIDNAIKHTTTAPYSPYQNGKSERTWRSLLEMARCLLADASLMKPLWSYAVRHAQYLRNRSYQRRTKKTAYELFTNLKPDMRKLHPFGSHCTFFLEGKKSKFQPRGYPGVYLGVNPMSQGYFILNLKNQGVITTRNVHIEEIVTEEPDAEVPPLQSGHIEAPDAPTNVDAPNTNEQEPEPDEPEENTNEPSAEHPRRDIRPPPKRFADYYLSANVDYAYAAVPIIPTSYEEAVNSEDAKLWKAAMDAEVQTLEQNETWVLSPLPQGRSETKGRWVYTIKQGKSEGEVQYKARYVAKGYSQIQGVDYDETYSPTTRFTSIRALLQKAANEGLHLHQMDVKVAYLNAPIDKEIYVQQPPGYEQTDSTGSKLSCHLKKSLYGLKQSGKNWHATLTDFLKSKGFIPNTNDPCVYTRFRFKVFDYSCSVGSRRSVRFFDKFRLQICSRRAIVI